MDSEEHEETPELFDSTVREGENRPDPVYVRCRYCGVYMYASEHRCPECGAYQDDNGVPPPVKVNGTTALYGLVAAFFVISLILISVNRNSVIDDQREKLSLLSKEWTPGSEEEDGSGGFSESPVGTRPIPTPATADLIPTTTPGDVRPTPAPDEPPLFPQPTATPVTIAAVTPTPVPLPTPTLDPIELKEKLTREYRDELDRTAPMLKQGGYVTVRLANGGTVSGTVTELGRYYVTLKTTQGTQPVHFRQLAPASRIRVDQRERDRYIKEKVVEAVLDQIN